MPSVRRRLETDLGARQGKAPKMSDAVLMLLGDRRRAEELAAHGRVFVKDLDWRAIARRHLTLAGISAAHG
jgi:hypothetical protein